MNTYSVQIFWFVLIVVTAPLLIGSAISLLVSAVLAAMQIQEQTTTFLTRLIAVVAIILVAWSWIEQRILSLFYDCFVTIAL